MPSAGALRAGRAVIELSLLTKPIEKGLRALQAKTRAISASFSNLGGAGLGGGGGITGLRNLFVGSAASAALAWPIRMASNIEVAAASLSVFVGGIDNAKALIMDLQQFSAFSLIPVEELATAASMLVRYGQTAKEAGASTKQLAVLAAGNAEEFQKLSLAFAQVGSAGRLQGEEMRQFKNTAFNPLREIAERTGETMLEVKKRMEAGTVSFNEVAQALAYATGPMGRFHGLLETISNTLTGQMKKALATFKLAILPIGNEMLAPLTRLFRAVNGIIPAFANLVKQNLRFVQIALVVGSAIAFAVVGFAGLSLTMSALGVAAAGFMSVLSLIATLASTVLSPIGLIAGTLVYLGYQFFTTTEMGKGMVSSLAGWFQNLYSIAVQTFGGIADALSAGDILLAGQIMWMGLKLAFLEGSATIMTKFREFKDVLTRTFIEISFSCQSTWIEMIAGLKKTWNEFKGWILDAFDVIVAKLAGIGETAAVKKQLQEDLVKKVGERMTTRNADNATINREQKTALDLVEANRAGSQRAQDSAFNKEQQDAKDSLMNLRKAFNEATEAAASEADQAKQATNLDLGGGGASGVFAGAKTAGKDNFKQPEALFDTSLARQMFGGQDDVQNEQLRVQKQIARNTAKPAGIAVT